MVSFWLKPFKPLATLKGFPSKTAVGLTVILLRRQVYNLRLMGSYTHSEVYMSSKQLIDGK